MADYRHRLSPLTYRPASTDIDNQLWMFRHPDVYTSIIDR
ncbi:hypothetical protein EDWATA_03592 [Edwardsiella tarda ATCC 23685]|uniref:Uncharacterized protein n=1 Tax=Edwardsiella tarda ATCC 23685 TaxID=500638 RepID=D4F9X6_EDWTA|nr:hypothetical protein EDWATA_03592 [Edwardsiella tarda ATCC 23685]